MNKLYKSTKQIAKAKILFLAFTSTLFFLLKGLLQGKFIERFRQFLSFFYAAVFQYHKALKDFDGNSHDAFFFNTAYNQKALIKIRELSKGLHSLLPECKQFFYSFILVVDQPKPLHLKHLLQTVVEQSAPHLEVLVGFRGKQEDEIYAILQSFQNAYPNLFFAFTYENSTRSTIANLLAEQAKGTHLILLQDDALLRPDLLYRYEQTIRLFEQQEDVIIYGREGKIGLSGKMLGDTESTKLDKIQLPYLFLNFNHGAFLISQKLWKKLNGLNENLDGAGIYDLILRAGKIGCQFIKVPVLLSVVREKEISDDRQFSISQIAVKSLKNFLADSGLNWKVSQGYFTGSLRAEPEMKHIPKIHIIIPYKNQKKLTLSAIYYALKQKNVKVFITAVDNRSDDHSIAEEIKHLGCEVIHIDEPFNYSRLNNLAVERTKIGRHCDLLFFMNNDVELDENALFEMSKWIDQPNIGTVGCRLHYPDGLLQCGGVDINHEWPKRFTGWDILQKRMPFQELDIQRLLRVSDGVNGASLLMKRELFLEIEGFDEIWYPIAHSDTNLSAKIKNKGLINFYTPYAFGIHHETVTREVSFMEDYENSTWLDENYFTVKA